MPVTTTGTAITFNDATSQTTAGYPNSNPNGYTSNAGTVTSVATGNGLQGGTITSTGTLSVACPGFNTVGSYAYGYGETGGLTNTNFTGGSNYSAGTSRGNVNSAYTNSLSGTWKWMQGTINAGPDNPTALLCRVS